MSNAKKTPPVLKQFAGFWTLSQQPAADKEWSDEEKIQRAKAAGFQAMGGGCSPHLVTLLEKYGMGYVCYVDGNMETYSKKLESVAAIKPTRVNAQVCDHDTLPKDAVKVWIKMAELADKLGLQADLEVHRDTATETPEKTYEIADLFEKETGKKIRLCWDFSHLAVIKHANPPYADRLIVRPDLIQLSRQMHFRPFNGHHAQIAATDGKGNETPEFKLYLDFLDTLLAVWFKGAKGGEEIYICPEFGPVNSGYGLGSFANVWDDAILLRQKTEDLFNANLKKAGF